MTSRMFVLSFVAFSFACLMALSSGCAAAKPAIAVNSYENGETVRYPLVLLKGELADRAISEVTATNTSSKRDSRDMQGPAYQGRFKVLAELVPGENRLAIRAGAQTTDFVLHYKPQTNPYKVRAVFFTDKTGDPTYESQFKDDSQNNRDKWDASLKLMQMFTAEEMRRNGYGRKTFNLELDEDGKVIVHIAKGKGSFEEMQKIEGGAVYDPAAEAIHEQLPKGPYKNLVCVAFSRHNKQTGRASAYTALGGDDVALMGGACFYTWPTGVKNILKTFLSDVQIDKANFHADDRERYAVWATAATTVGSGLHEVGHTFTLPHTLSHKRGIMLRGADSLNRYFSFIDPPCDTNNRQYTRFPDSEQAYWSDVSAAALAPSRWLALDDRTYTQANTISFAIDAKTGELVARSDDGLAFLCVELPGQAEDFDKLANLTALPKERRLSLAAIAARHKTSRLSVRAEDGMGHYRDANLQSMLDKDPAFAPLKALFPAEPAKK
ncbi:MAG: hypothetical protein WCK05_02065 [Planctomycetota bacterium]